MARGNRVTSTLVSPVCNASCALFRPSLYYTTSFTVHINDCCLPKRVFGSVPSGRFPTEVQLPLYTNVYTSSYGLLPSKRAWILRRQPVGLGRHAALEAFAGGSDCVISSRRVGVVSAVAVVRLFGNGPGRQQGRRRRSEASASPDAGPPPSLQLTL